MIIKSIVSWLKRRVKSPWCVATLGVFIVLLGILMVLCHDVDTRARVDAARPADAIIVLGSAVWPNEKPSPSLTARTQHAIELYQAGYAPYLIFCGGLGENPPTEAEAMRRMAAAAGVPAQAMILEDRSHSTEENLANAKALMEARGLKSAVIVSDPFHLLRAEMVARDLGLDAVGSGASNSPAFADVRWRTWYTFRESIALVWYGYARVVGEPAWLYGILKKLQI